MIMTDLRSRVLINTLFFCVLIACLSSCSSAKHSLSMIKIPPDFDWQGHRGCRGLMPENTVAGFLEALKYPVRTLEMDVVISKDGEIIVSHEPWMNHAICTTPEGKDIRKSEEQKYILYTLTRGEIQQFDCGSKGNAKFPRQKKQAAIKPTLSEVVSSLRAFCMAEHRPIPAFNIELKSHPEGYGVFVPHPEEFTRLVVTEIRKLGIGEITTLQSFDPQVLRLLHTAKLPDVKISYLVSNGRNIKQAIATLGFTPDIYSPRFRLLSRRSVEYAHSLHMRVIPWTVNDVKHFHKLIELGVDGIITDYPDLIEEATGF